METSSHPKSTPVVTPGQDSEPPPLLTVAAAATLAGISRQAMTRRVNRGTMKATKVEIQGKLVTRIALADLEGAYPGVTPDKPAAPTLMTPAGLNTVDRSIEHASLSQETSSKAVAVLDKDYRGAMVELKAELAQVREVSRADLAASQRRERQKGAGLLVTGISAAALAVFSWAYHDRAQVAEVQAADAKELVAQERERVGELSTELIDAKADALSKGTQVLQIEAEKAALGTELESTALELETAKEALRERVLADLHAWILRWILR